MGKIGRVLQWYMDDLDELHGSQEDGRAGEGRMKKIIFKGERIRGTSSKEFAHRLMQYRYLALRSEASAGGTWHSLLLDI